MQVEAVGNPAKKPVAVAASWCAVVHTYGVNSAPGRPRAELRVANQPVLTRMFWRVASRKEFDACSTRNTLKSLAISTSLIRLHVLRVGQASHTLTRRCVLHTSPLCNRGCARTLTPRVMKVRSVIEKLGSSSQT